MDSRSRMIQDALRLARQYGVMARGYADGGSPVDEAVAKKPVKKTKEKKSKFKTHEGRVTGNEMMPIHPAMRIPGVHIRTAEAGEPIFHGDE